MWLPSWTSIGPPRNRLNCRRVNLMNTFCVLSRYLRASACLFSRSPHRGVEVVEETILGPLIRPRLWLLWQCGRAGWLRLHSDAPGWADACELSVAASSLKAPVLSSKLLRTTSALVGKGDTQARINISKAPGHNVLSAPPTHTHMCTIKVLKYSVLFIGNTSILYRICTGMGSASKCSAIRLPKRTQNVVRPCLHKEQAY